MHGRNGEGRLCCYHKQSHAECTINQKRKERRKEEVSYARKQNKITTSSVA